MNPNRTPVAIVYGLVEDKINCTHLFNILCLYGNVAKIKFMKSKPGCAMVEFTDTDAVTKATKLTGAELYGSKLRRWGKAYFSLKVLFLGVCVLGLSRFSHLFF